MTTQNPFDVFQEEESAINKPQPAQPSFEQVFPNYKQQTTSSPSNETFSFERYNFDNKPTTSYDVDVDDELRENIPIRQEKPKQPQSSGEEDLNQPPLLEDLGIDPLSIRNKVLTVITLKKSDAVLNTPDLTGPLAIAIGMGCLLMLAGKLHFGQIIGVTVIGATLLYFLLNMISSGPIIPIYTVMSVLGYSQAPMLLLAFARILSGVNQFMVIMSMAVAVWAAVAATIFFQAILATQHKKWLIGYPVFLFYLTFIIIIVF